MFSIAAVMFAVFMGFFMSMTITLFITLILSGLSLLALTGWLKLWVIAYPVAVIAIIIYRPLALFLSGKVVRWWQTRHQW